MWYSRICAAPEGDFTPLGEALEWFEAEYQSARKEVKIEGRVEVFMMRLPGLVEYYWRHLQELEAILEWLEIIVDKATAKARRNYLENYQRNLTDRMAEKYAENDPEVIDLRLLKVEVSYMRNQFLGIHKALDVAQYQVTNFRALRIAGLEDASVSIKF